MTQPPIPSDTPAPIPPESQPPVPLPPPTVGPYSQAANRLAGPGQQKNSTNRWWRKTWFVAIAAAIVGFTVGAVGVTSSPESSAPATGPTLAAASASAQADQQKLADLQDQLATVTGERDSLQQQVDTMKPVYDKAQAAAEQAAKNSFGDGVMLVNKDIAPGQYRSANESGNCYWARLSGVSGDFKEILANGNPDGPTVVQISPSDVAFESAQCGTWTKVG